MNQHIPKQGKISVFLLEDHEIFRRERRIKEWRRSWKLLLIEETNPTWRDLYDTLNGEPDPDGALRSWSRHSPG